MQLALFEFINKTIEEFELNHATYEYVENNLKRILNEALTKNDESVLKISSRIKNKDSLKEKLIRNNNDIILGSDLGYVAYDKEYKEIFALEEVPKDDKTVNNSIHLTAASLSQVGKDSAKNAAKYLKNK